MVASSPKPTAPPVCRDVFKIADASPASCGSTPATAAVVTAIKPSAAPIGRTMKAGRMSDVYVPWSGKRANSPNATAVISIPIASTGLAPIRPISRDATPGTRMKPMLMGR